MQAAFFVVGVFPPPTARPDILSLFDRPGAGGAADARIILFVERVDRNFVLFDIILNLVQRPVGNRVDFNQGRAISILANFLNVGARDVLIPADTGDPRLQRR